jgi:hypothetical protein
MPIVYQKENEDASKKLVPLNRDPLGNLTGMKGLGKIFRPYWGVKKGPKVG